MTGPTNKSKQRKLDILKTAQELFNTKGFQETSVEDIMRGIGAAKGVFYYYFETKEQILDTLIEQNIGRVVESAAAVLEKDGLDALQKLRYILQEQFKAGMEDYNPENHIHNIKAVDMHQRIIKRMVEKLAPVIAAAIEQGIREGLFNTEFPLEVSEIMLAGVQFVTDLGIFDWSREQYIRKVKASEEMIEKALGIEKGSFSFLSGMLQNIPDMVAAGRQRFDHS